MRYPTQTLYCEDYTDTVERLYRSGEQVDIVVTSPPYNTNKKQGKSKTLINTQDGGSYPYVRYDTVLDAMTKQEYSDFLCRFMVDMDYIVKANGVVVINLSYGNENPDGIWLAVSSIIESTKWTVADCIVWKKKSAMPNNCSHNRLTRICEYLFVFARKDELSTFKSNKSIKSIRRTGQKSYESKPNFIEAPNNDGPCPFNKATYSSELVLRVLDLYAPKYGVCYDPFVGSGTTLVACAAYGMDGIGSEISTRQCDWAASRIGQYTPLKYVNDTTSEEV